MQFIDPRKRILRNVRAEQFTEIDFNAINEYICKRGASVLATTNDDGGLAFQDPDNLLQN